MKIYNCGLDIQPGKYKYKGEYFDKLVDKFKPQKQTPYSVEIIDTLEPQLEAVVYRTDKKIDLIVSDLEKIEVRLSRVEQEDERQALMRAQAALEKEILLCDSELDAKDLSLLKALSLISFKPCLAAERVDNIEELIGAALEKAGIILFFTAGKKEVRAWGIRKGSSILEAAGKIHSDLQRGFIKADVVNCSQLDNFFNMAEARSRGLVKVVDRDYIMRPNDIIEVRFNV